MLGETPGGFSDTDTTSASLTALGVLTYYFLYFQTSAVGGGSTPPTVVVTLDSAMTFRGEETTNFGTNAWSGLTHASDDQLTGGGPAITNTLLMTAGYDPVLQDTLFEAGVFRVFVNVTGVAPPEYNQNRYTQRRFIGTSLPYDLVSIRLGEGE